MPRLKTRSAATEQPICLFVCRTPQTLSACCTTQSLRLAWIGANTWCVCFPLYIQPVMKWWLVQTWRGSAPHTPSRLPHRLDPELEISVPVDGLTGIDDQFQSLGYQFNGSMAWDVCEISVKCVKHYSPRFKRSLIKRFYDAYSSNIIENNNGRYYKCKYGM